MIKCLNITKARYVAMNFPYGVNTEYKIWVDLFDAQ